MILVTSFHVNSWDKYAKRFVESFKKFWPKKVKLYAFYHDGDLPEDAPTATNITYRKLNQEDMLKFKERHKDKNGGSPYNYRLDAIKFCHKVFALTGMAEELRINKSKQKWLFWLDADTVSKKKLPLKEIKNWLDEDTDIVYLGRKAIDYCESSFLAFNMDKVPSHVFLEDFRSLYLSGELFGYREWHDGFAFERLLRMHQQHGLRTHNLTPECDDLQAFNSSPLAEYLHHFKGPEKEGHAPVRYNHIVEMIGFYKPQTLLETGTWNGDRAIQMCLAALQANPGDIRYEGYDLFQEGNKELDNLEFNSKPNVAIDKVSKKLDRLKDLHPRFDYRLHKGDTRKIMKHHKVDFAYLDGGHSLETASSDFENVRGSNVIVMDDYFREDEAGEMPPDKWCGTNKVYDAYEGRKFLIKSPDLVNVGGKISLAVIIEKGEDPPNINRTAVPIIVNPVDCVEKSYLHDNIKENLKLIPNFIDKKFDWHSKKMVIVSGGPSLKDNLEDIREAQREGADIMCVKHSYPTLIGAGINPWACIILDPRSLEGKSTHGIVRRTLLEKKSAFSDTVFLVATMTNPEVTQYLLDRGDLIVGWNAFSQASSKLPELKNKMLVTGGTCAAMRAVGLGHTMGYRIFDLYGFDSCVEEPTEKEKKELEETTEKPKYLEVGIGGRKFWTTGELLAQAQDFERLVERNDVDMHLEVFGEGMIPALWENMQAQREVPESFSDFLSSFKERNTDG